MVQGKGNFLDRILEAVVAVCTVLFVMGGPASLALIGGLAVGLRLFRLWGQISGGG